MTVRRVTRQAFGSGAGIQKQGGRPAGASLISSLTVLQSEGQTPIDTGETLGPSSLLRDVVGLAEHRMVETDEGIRRN